VLEKFNRKYPGGEDKLRALKSYFSDGFEFPLKFIPENVICWCSGHNLPDVVPQMHSRFCLSIVLRDNVVRWVEGIPFLLHEDESILVFPTQSHNLKKIPGSSRLLMLHITFSFSQNANIDCLNPLKNRVCKLDGNMTRLTVKIMEAVYSSQSDGKDYSVVPLELAQLLNLMLAACKNLSADQQNGNRSFEKILHYIRGHYQDRTICLKTVADAVGLSPSRLSAIFREQMPGISIGYYIARLKFFRSMELLCSTNMSIAEIAQCCGYSNPFSFSRRFKSMCDGHLSPTQFRDAAKISRPAVR
ncbi:MAG: helix-turn-helix transcriptional regulator, partial [Lentisphaeria bacterium]|nr:helix-turn-helix transcriptional regulator [Lentisphaeria bacterium]